MARRRAGRLRRSTWSPARGAGICCSTRRTCTCRAASLFGSFLVAIFFNNFLPSNIGGDVIRIRDTAPAARLEDAGRHRRPGGSRPRPDGAGARRGARRHDGGRACTAHGGSPIWPSWLWAGFLAGRSRRGAGGAMRPPALGRAAAAAHRASSGMGRRPHRDADRDARRVPRRARRRSRLLRRRRLRAGARSSSSTSPSPTRCTSR